MLGIVQSALYQFGSEAVKPFATVIIGGLISATLLTLTCFPRSTPISKNHEKLEVHPMKEIRAYIEPFMLSKVTQALLEIPDFPGMSVSDCEGFGQANLSPDETLLSICQKSIEILASDELVEIIFNTIMLTANTH